jgi:hypothetical protein
MPNDRQDDPFFVFPPSETSANQDSKPEKPDKASATVRQTMSRKNMTN